MQKFWIPILALLISRNATAQLIPTDENGIARQYPFVSTVFNRVFNNTGLDSFYEKLYRLKKNGEGTVTIVHIGDSHVQADFFSGVVRQRLQQFFGNAGRGMVFPYQVAQSNAPPDILSSSNTSWEYNRLAHPEIPITPGVSGFIIRTDAQSPSIDLSLRNNDDGSQSFNRLKFFLDNSSSWILQANNNSAPFLIKKEEGDSSVYREVKLDQLSGGFTLSALPSDNTKEFYGVSLENSNAGVLYHNIGVNGIRYDQYNNASIFWGQLSSLHADLYIISLGTNEAQGNNFDNETFQQQVKLFVERLRLVSPSASVLICTTADSYRRRRSNPVLREVNISLYNFCVKHDIPIWDLYRITNGYGSAYNWARHGLMNPDRIHFTADGYRVQGNLLFNALAKGYNNYVSNY